LPDGTLPRHQEWNRGSLIFAFGCRNHDARRLLFICFQSTFSAPIFHTGCQPDRFDCPRSLEDQRSMNIALIAMSGIRACDEELLRLGLTLPGFVERSKTIASLPSLGLLTLAALTPSEHHVQYIEIPNLSDVDTLPDGFDLVAISSYSAQINEAYLLAARYRDLNIPVVIGGPHVSVLPDEALKYCDAVVIGEGEPCWERVLEDCSKGNMKGKYDATGLNYDLADSPIPSFELLDISKYNRLTVQTSRGCPHHCEFCAGSVILTSGYKQKPVEKVLREIDKILSIWEHPFLEFADDNSFVNKSYWKELLGALEGKRMKWFAETDISVAEDEELLTLMHRTGCSQVLIGLESPVKGPLHGLETKNNWKLGKFPLYKEAINTIQSHGITVNGCFILGLDGQTSDIFDQVFSFVKDSGLYEVQITLLTPFPGTPLYQRMKNENRLLEPDNWKKCTLFDINFKPSAMSLPQLNAGFKRLAVDLYSEEFTNRRRRNFMDVLRKHNIPKEA
jgi:radical SAM superfamily enzyme YgiQ (UPF0313 family)